MSERHPAIVNWTEIEKTKPWQYPGHDEPMSFKAPLGRHFGLMKLGIHHERIPAGHRLSFPHAESAEEEFVYVLEGTPDAWLDGEIFRLKPGDAVGFQAGTGLTHTFINNTADEVHVLVVGEKSKPDNRITYPRNPARREQIGERWWDDAPARPLGPHDGLPDARRAARAAEGKPE